MVGLPLEPFLSEMKGFGVESCQFGLPPSIQVQFSLFVQMALNLQDRARQKILPFGREMRWIDQDVLLKEVEGQGLFDYSIIQNTYVETIPDPTTQQL
jgi:hypothetical protein